MENLETSLEGTALGYLKIVVREIHWLTNKEYESLLIHLNPKFVRSDINRRHFIKYRGDPDSYEFDHIVCDFKFNTETGNYKSGQLYSIVMNDDRKPVKIRRCGTDFQELSLYELSPEAILTAIQEIEVLSILSS